MAVIGYHNGDTYTNSFSNARLAYYGISSSPTAKFDGILTVSGGGNASTSMYGAYLPKYNQRIAVQSSFTIEIEGSNSGMVEYELNITLNKVASVSATNMVMHLVVTESDIQQSWQGMTELNHVERLMVPNQSGTPVDFSTTNTLQLTKTFLVDPNWVVANSEVIVFIQNLSNKEILQATIASLSEFPINNNYDASVVTVVAPLAVCKDSFVPKVKIANFGLDNLTSLEIEMQMNNEQPVTYNWTGDLPFLESEILELPDFSFSILPANTFTVTCNNPNGQPDQYTSNNTQIISIEEAQNVTSPVKLILKLDENPEQTTWTLVDSEGTTLFSGGPYTVPNQFLTQTFDLPTPDCYTFNFYDSGGDGLLGSGMYKLLYEGTTVFAQDENLEFEEQHQFSITVTDINEAKTHPHFNVSPNPIPDKAGVSFYLIQSSPVQLKMFNSTGALVFEITEQVYQAGNHTIQFENKNLIDGIYYLQLSFGETVHSKKVLVKQ